MKTIGKLLLFLVIVTGMQATSFAQCKTFTKDYCKPKLHPYIYNGQLNSAVLNEGDMAELMLTFYSNQDYRIVVCAAEDLKNVRFRLIDQEGNELFTNEDHNYIDYWDFRTRSTQQLTVEVSIPDAKGEELIKSGCVSILIGFIEN